MQNSKLITVKIDEELNALIESVSKEYSINLSSLIRRLLLNELNNTNKYRRF